MKNNTKVRLHLSKHLFEALTRQVVAESKGNMGGGAYTETVKVPKSGKIKEVNAVADTDKMKKKMEEMETNVYEKSLEEMKAEKAHLDKKIQEMEMSSKKKMEEAGGMPTTSMEMGAKALFGADNTFAVGMGLVALVAGGILTAMHADELKKAKDSLIGWWRGAKADLSQEEKQEIINAAEKGNVSLPGADGSGEKPVAERAHAFKKKMHKSM